MPLPAVTNRSAAMLWSSQSLRAYSVLCVKPAVRRSRPPVAARAATTRPVRPGLRTRLSAASRPSRPSRKRKNGCTSRPTAPARSGMATRTAPMKQMGGTNDPMRGGRLVRKTRRRHAHRRQQHGGPGLQDEVERPDACGARRTASAGCSSAAWRAGSSDASTAVTTPGRQGQQHHRPGDGQRRRRQLDEDLAQHLLHRLEGQPGQAVAQRQAEQRPGQPQQRRLADEQPGDLAARGRRPSAGCRCRGAAPPRSPTGRCRRGTCRPAAPGSRRPRSRVPAPR